jgi:F-type H+-transporting ATPase subunit b
VSKINNFKKLFVLLLASSPLLANSGAELDIGYRTMNFVIFAGIAYYILAEHVKNFFADRTKSIQTQIDEVKDTLAQSEKKVNDAKAELENAKTLAKELVESAKSEISKIELQVQESTKSELENLSRIFDNRVELETKKMKKEVVASVIEKLFSDDTIKLSSKELGNIVSQKVA